MKKMLALGLALVLSLCVVGCSEKSMTFDIGEANKIELRSGADGTMVEITNAEDIKYITDNINALTFSKGKSSKDHNGWSYSLKWYDSENVLMEEIVVMSEYQIDYKDYFYKGMEVDNKIDLAYFDRLLNPENNANQENDDAVLKEPPNLTLSVNGQEGLKKLDTTKGLRRPNQRAPTLKKCRGSFWLF